MTHDLVETVGTGLGPHGLAGCCIAMLTPEGEHWADLATITILILILGLVVLFHRRMIKEIRRTERGRRLLLENAPFAVVVTSQVSGRFLFANRHAVDLLALSQNNYSQQTIRYVGPEPGRSRLLEELGRRGEIDQLEFELESYSGQRIHAIGSAASIDYNGEQAILCSLENISKLKETELKLRSSEARLQAVLQVAPDGIIILTSDGIIRHATDSCAALVGVPDKQTMIGRQILDFLDPKDRPSAAELLASTMRHAINPGASAFKITRPDGTHVWIEPRAVPLHDPISGQPVIVLVLRNITLRREAQEEVATHARELEEALTRIAHLQNELLRVCAWTKEVNVDGKWIPIDHYLTEYLGLKITHGISENGIKMLGLSERQLKRLTTPDQPPPQPEHEGTGTGPGSITPPAASP